VSRAEIPEPFAALLRGRAAEGGPTGDEWLDGLPGLVRECLQRWELRLDGAARHGVCALVLPVRGPSGPAALKLTWPHPEATHEHLALRYWAGRGAVRLLAADPPRWALLLERLDPDRDLSAEPIFDACATIGSLLAELDRPAPAQLERLSQHASRWAVTLRRARRIVPQRFLDRAAALAEELAADPRADARMVHTDLHFANVLAGQRESWLAIDPKPLAAEPAFAIAPALWNRWPEAAAAPDTRDHLRRRLEIICETAGIDPDRARAWTLVREAVNAMWAAAQPDAATPARIDAAVTIMKAMQT
jgi:streptomycin 6-kinase